MLKLALMKFGVGQWKEIVESGCLPGKLIQQLNGQTQRLLGQQSLASKYKLPNSSFLSLFHSFSVRLVVFPPF